jgi:uncharacterized membrane protein HdeD (DUF308 family)
MTTPTGARQTPPQTSYDYSDDQGTGWMAFAGVLLVLVGVINLIQGLAAIDNANFYVHNTHYVFGSLNTWGWVAAGIGLVQVVCGFGIFSKNQAARWVGVLALGLNAIAQLLMMPAYPFWSLSIFALDIIAIYGLIVHGRRLESAY